MKMVNIPSVSLKGCEKAMPVIGMGTSAHPPADMETAKGAILEAMKAGYRHFDTAFAYGSEKALGQAIKEGLSLGLIKSRDELFVTTKLWPAFAEENQIVSACKMSLQNLELEYVDMYLIHFPMRLKEMIRKIPVEEEIIGELDVEGVWKGMEECKKLGLTKGIGVSNFSCKKLHQLLSIAKIPPALNQVEMNPAWHQKQLIEFCREKGVHITAYSPLGANNTRWGDNRIVENDVITNIARLNEKSTAQIALRWAYEQGVSIVAKSFNKERMKQNLEIFDWSLSCDDLQNIAQIPQRKGCTLASIWGQHKLILDLDAEV